MKKIVLKRKVVSFGRSLAVTIPQELVDLFEITKNHIAHYTIENDNIILKFKKEVEKK